MTEREKEIELVLNLLRNCLECSNLRLQYNGRKGCMTVIDCQNNKEYALLQPKD